MTKDELNKLAKQLRIAQEDMVYGAISPRQEKIIQGERVDDIPPAVLERRDAARVVHGALNVLIHALHEEGRYIEEREVRQFKTNYFDKLR